MSWSISIQTHVGDLNLDVRLSGDDTPTIIIGPNGSGKTTLLRVISGCHPVEKGHIEINGTIHLDTQKAIASSPERRGIGYVPQSYALFSHLSVMENVAFGLRYSGLNRSKRHKVAQQMLDQLGSAHLVNKPLNTLSGGQQQRVALARALVVEPDLVLLDEPMAALDAKARRQTRNFLHHHLRQPGMSTIITTHDIRDVIALQATVVVLDSGSVIQTGSLQQLRAAPANDFVAEFTDTSFDITPISSANQ